MDEQADIETNRRISRPRALSSPTTESTRNGMSSLTISSTAAPRGAAAGSKRILATPASRSARNAQDGSAMPASSSAL
jgi:hypothetical protein